MFLARLAASMIFLAALSACGGASSDASALSLAPASAPVQVKPGTVVFVANYELSTSSIFPNGTMEVSPPSGTLYIGLEPVAKVEFLQFGYDTQVLTAANFSPKDNPQLRYVFKLPDGFLSGSYACNGTHLSEVRVTFASGAVVSRTFEMCPGTPLTVTGP